MYIDTLVILSKVTFKLAEGTHVTKLIVFEVVSGERGRKAEVGDEIGECDHESTIYANLCSWGRVGSSR